MQTLFEERVPATVAVTFTIEREVDREDRRAYGTVLNDEGLIILNAGEIPNWLPPDQLKDVRVHLPGADDDGHPAEYLGPQLAYGWHYIRAPQAIRDQLTPITAFPTATVRLGDPIWGIGLLDAELNSQPYLLRSELALVQQLPEPVGFTPSEVASPGLPVFNLAGAFVGFARTGSPGEYRLFMRGQSYNVGLMSRNESTVILMAEPFLEASGKPPADPVGDPRPWIGVTGLQPLEKDTARYLGLDDQGAIVISDVLAGGPAAEAGVRGGDILVGLNGDPLPKYTPDWVTRVWLEQALARATIGEPLGISVVRGEEPEPLELTLVPQESPDTLREAERTWLPDLGLTVREFTVLDALNQRILKIGVTGAVVNYVRPNSPAATAGLRGGDWIREIGAETIETYEQAVARFEALSDQEGVEEIVVLVQRTNETEVLRIKLD
ncbi:MAG: PDZ domain-containing protein [Opitutales bacterium]